MTVDRCVSDVLVVVPILLHSLRYNDRFSESEVLSCGNYPKEAYTVRIKDTSGIDNIVKIGTWLLIPLSNYKRVCTALISTGE